MAEKLYKHKRQKLELQREEMLQDRSSLEADWRDVADFISPHRLELNPMDATRHERRLQHIIDGSISHSRSILEAGMTTSICSPSRPWFRTKVPDPDLTEWGPAKEWLHTAQRVMLDTFSSSNYYMTVPTVFGDMATFGTPAMSLEEDFESVISALCFPIGSFYGAVDHKNRLRVFGRDFLLTVRQVVEMFVWDEKTRKFDWSVVSKAVKNMWDRENYGATIEIRHQIVPNLEYKDTGLSKDKRFCSYYWEAGSSGDKFLREKGYDHMPYLCPRWHATGHRFWATDCPGFRALGNTMQLQKGEELGLMALELEVRPPMTAHPDLQATGTTQIPGGVTWTESHENFRPLMAVKANLKDLAYKQAEVRELAKRFYHEDLWLRIASDRRNQRATAEELIQGKEEMFMVMQPVLTNVDRDLNNPALDINFMMNLRQRRFPDPPKELAGMPIQIEFTNLMTIAQRMQGIAVQDRFLAFGERLVKINPESADKFDFDQMADEYGESLGISPRIIRSDERVEEIRASRNQAQAAQAQSEAMLQGTQAIKNLAQAPTSGDNALADLAAMSAAGANA